MKFEVVLNQSTVARNRDALAYSQRDVINVSANISSHIARYVWPRVGRSLSKHSTDKEREFTQEQLTDILSAIATVEYPLHVALSGHAPKYNDITEVFWFSDMVNAYYHLKETFAMLPDITENDFQGGVLGATTLMNGVISSANYEEFTDAQRERKEDEEKEDLY